MKLIFLWAAVISLHGEMPREVVMEGWRAACFAWEPAATIEFRTDIGHVNGQPAAIMSGTCTLEEAAPEPEPEEENYDA